MGQSSDEIRQEINQHRNDAASKIDQLQSQVQGTSDDLQQQAKDTAEQVRNQVQGTVEDTIETVKENIDLQQQVQERPLVALGAALIGGFVLGGILGGGQSQSSHGGRSNDYSGGNAQSGSGSGSKITDSVRDMVKKSGLEETFSNATAAMMGSVTEQIKDTLDRNMPGFAEKMDTAKQEQGSVTDKSRVTQP